MSEKVARWVSNLWWTDGAVEETGELDWDIGRFWPDTSLNSVPRTQHHAAEAEAHTHVARLARKKKYRLQQQIARCEKIEREALARVAELEETDV